MSDVRTAPTGPDPRERFFKHFFRMVNPLARWMMSVGSLLAAGTFCSRSAVGGQALLERCP